MQSGFITQFLFWRLLSLT